MIPLKDTIRSRSFPLVNWLIIAINTVVFFIELGLTPQGLQQFIMAFGVVPASLDPARPLSLVPLFTHMFLHGGWFHFLSNMWVLFIFGDNVEDRLGSSRYLFFYLLGGLVAGAIQAVSAPGSQTPAIGASGAIAAVMGAYFLFYPRARVTTLIPIFIFPWFVDIPAIIYLGFWFVSQLFSGVSALAAAGTSAGGVAWWAHIGGFLFGLLMGKLFSLGRPDENWRPDEYRPW